MKRIYLFLLAFISISLNGQTISSIISEVHQDSLVKIVREFSGEDSCFVNGNKVLIRNRTNGSQGNNLAADYLKEMFSKFGLSVQDQNYSSGGRNIIGTQLSSKNPDSLFLICGHYDGVADYCADDNASGIAVVLEAARILKGKCFNYTVIYALWDEEETGLNGSKFYSDEAKQQGKKIVGVLNMDMMGYDGNNDRAFDIDLNNHSGSIAIKDKLISIVNDHNLNLNVHVVNPGTDASDHGSFWANNYGAVLLGESWETKDQNPKYHSAEDRISLFNLPYFTDLAKLGIGGIAALSKLCSITTSIEDVEQEIVVFPNPTSGLLHLDIGMTGGFIVIYNLMGEKIDQKPILNAQEVVDLGSLSSGEYILQISNDQIQKTLRVVRK